jgi:hypothetical protein
MVSVKEQGQNETSTLRIAGPIASIQPTVTPDHYLKLRKTLDEYKYLGPNDSEQTRRGLVGICGRWQK